MDSNFQTGQGLSPKQIKCVFEDIYQYQMNPKFLDTQHIT